MVVDYRVYRFEVVCYYRLNNAAIMIGWSHLNQLVIMSHW